MIDIYRKVKNLKNHWGTNDPFKICNYLDIEIIYFDLGKSKGFYKKAFGQKIIVLNENLSEIDKKIVCAHELGHCLLHSRKETEELLLFEHLVKPSKLENEANEFAAYLLIELDCCDCYESSINPIILEKLKIYINNRRV